MKYLTEQYSTQCTCIFTMKGELWYKRWYAEIKTKKCGKK